MLAKLHLAEDAFTLQLSLQRFQCLVDIVISNKYLHAGFPFLKSGCSAKTPTRLFTMT